MPDSSVTLKNSTGQSVPFRTFQDPAGNHAAYDKTSATRNAISVTPVVSTSPVYSPGDAVGGKMSFANAALSAAGSGIINQVIISDLHGQNGEYDLVLFSSDPSATTVTDNAALTIADADLIKIIAVVNVSTWFDFATNSAGQQSSIGTLVFKLSAGTTLYGILVSRSVQSPQVSPDFASTSDLTVTIVVTQD